jgi:hypothetical protein
VLHPDRVEDRAPSHLVVPRELEIVPERHPVAPARGLLAPPCERWSIAVKSFLATNTESPLTGPLSALYPGDVGVSEAQRERDLPRRPFMSPILAQVRL